MGSKRGYNILSKQLKNHIEKHNIDIYNSIARLCKWYWAQIIQTQKI